MTMLSKFVKLEKRPNFAELVSAFARNRKSYLSRRSATLTFQKTTFLVNLTTFAAACRQSSTLSKHCECSTVFMNCGKAFNPR